MSINIGGDVVKIATSIDVVVQTSKMGPRQLTAMRRAVRTGVVTGDSLPSRLAVHVLDEHSMPYILQSTYRIGWFRVEEDEEDFFLAIKTVVAAAQLNDVKTSGMEDELEAMRKAAHTKDSHFATWVGRGVSAKLVKRAKFKHTMPGDYEVPRTFTFNALNGRLP
jgi:hypothetical protein